VPVSSVTADLKLALEGVSKKSATFEPNPATPVDIGNPTQLVKFPAKGVPKSGFTSVRAVNNCPTLICLVTSL
jgi:hypothetical protein